MKVLKWFRNFSMLVLCLTLNYQPHRIGWVFVFGGWFIHSQLYETAISVFMHFSAPPKNADNVQAWRSIALVHTYMGQCEEAIRVYEEEIMPIRKRLYQEDGFVMYRPNEISDYVRIYGDCAGRTEQTFQLTEDARDRLVKSSSKIVERLKRNAELGSATTTFTLRDFGSNLAYVGLVTYAELGSGSVMRSTTPTAVTKLAVIPTHAKYIELLERYLPAMQLSQPTSNPVVDYQHHWRSDTLSSTYLGFEAARFFGVFSGPSRLKRILFLSVAAWRFWGITKDRSTRHTIVHLLKRHDAAKSTKHKLAILEQARLNMMNTPTRPFELLQGIGIGIVGEAIQSLVQEGNVEEVDRLVPLVKELWDVKRAAEIESDNALAAANHRLMSKQYIWELFVTSPAKVRWVKMEITSQEEFHEIIKQRQTIWDRSSSAITNTTNVTNATRVDTMRSAVAADASDSVVLESHSGDINKNRAAKQEL